MYGLHVTPPNAAEDKETPSASTFKNTDASNSNANKSSAVTEPEQLEVSHNTNDGDNLPKTQHPPSPPLSPIQHDMTHNHDIDVQDSSSLSFAFGSIGSCEERTTHYLSSEKDDADAERPSSIIATSQRQQDVSQLTTQGDVDDQEEAKEEANLERARLTTLVVMQRGAEAREAKAAAEAERLKYTSPDPTHTYKWGDSNFKNSLDSAASESQDEYGDCSGDQTASQEDLEELLEPPQKKNSSAEHYGEETSIVLRERDTDADNAVNATADSSFSTLNPNVLEKNQLQSAWTMTHWTKGKQINSQITIICIQARPSQLLLDEGKTGIDACLIYAQTKPRGPLDLYSRRFGDSGSRIVDILRIQNHGAALSAAAAAAFKGQNRRIEIPGGCKGEASGEEGSALTAFEDDNGVRRAPNKYCLADALYSAGKSVYPDLVLTPYSEVGKDGEAAIEYKDKGLLIRHLVCDKHGYATMKDLTRTVNGSNVFQFNLVRVTEKNYPGVQVAKPEARRDRIIEESKNNPNRAFVLQCLSHSSSASHYVGLANGFIYDNDLETGGKIPAEKFCEDYLAGIRKAVEIIPRAPSSGGNKKKSEKKRKRANESSNTGTTK
mmetsp:Transcript_30839/g.68331  ORF Transcript_30839/g.68331 Transcript_30839/m.68331 type:complete len:608 (-) Transcript_30839:73-1896(-)